MENGFSGFKRLAALTMTLALSFGVINTANSATHIKKGADSVPGEIVVKMKGSADGKVHANRLQKLLGGSKILSIRPLRTNSSIQVVKLSSEVDTKRTLGVLANSPEVEIAEPNYLYYAMNNGAPNDPAFQQLWGLLNQGQADSSGQAGTPGSDVNVLPLWTQGVTGSRNILVAVIDTGVEWEHPDLKTNIFTNAGEIAGNGIDDDGNGFIDDTNGWNFAADSNRSNDDHDHGTHCAGTIGAEGNNGVGVAGVTWNASILPIKFLTASGSGSLADAVESINYATLMKANIMSNSWGGGGYSQIMEDAIKAARDAGILFVAAAGNSSSNNDSSPAYPASYDVENVVSVAATDNRDQLASFSSYGRTKVHVAAPGVRVHSTVTDGKYATFSGTSMATPHVSGIAALIWAAHPTLTYAEVKERLISTSIPVSALRTKVVAGGRVDAYNAVHNIVPPRNEPDPSKWVDVPMTIESEHPYKDNADVVFPVHHAGAKFIRVFFDRVDTEAKYDFVSLEDANGTAVERLTGQMAGYFTDYVPGNTAAIRLRSDSSVNSWGFKISKIQVILNE